MFHYPSDSIFTLLQLPLPSMVQYLRMYQVFNKSNNLPLLPFRKAAWSVAGIFFRVCCCTPASRCAGKKLLRKISFLTISERDKTHGQFQMQWSLCSCSAPAGVGFTLLRSNPALTSLHFFMLGKCDCWWKLCSLMGTLSSNSSGHLCPGRGEVTTRGLCTTWEHRLHSLV